ncbi:bifunctional riboflavin kinase/FAD synthetase [Flavobacteriaceae sp. LMIT009]
MNIKATLDTFPNKDSVVTIGTFDGVHVGHQKIINKLVKIAKKEDLHAAILTFFPHPRMVLQSDSNIKLINTIDEKSEILQSFGVDNLVIHEFTREFSRLTALEFVRDVLVDKLHVKHLIVGYDHRFGRNRSANIEDLREFGETYNFKITEISAKEIDEVAVSSTKIRNSLIEGDIQLANKYLGYKFLLTGKVVKGRSLGSKIGFPTANIEIEEQYKLIPKNGSYVVKVHINNSVVYGMMNIGENPTIEGKGSSIEVHLFDFSENIYNQYIKIELLDRLRDEQKFDSVEDLIAQLSKDKKTSLNYIQNTNA